MSAISGYISQIQNAVYGEQVRSAIVSALEACYSDVENPDLQSAAFLVAINEAYASGILDITEVTQVSQMTNENIIYRYMGTQAGYTANTLYYYNGTAWVPIGSGVRAVNNTSLMTDTTAIYKYTGTQSGMVQNALYYHNGTSWVQLLAYEAESPARIRVNLFTNGTDGGYKQLNYNPNYFTYFNVRCCTGLTPIPVKKGDRVVMDDTSGDYKFYATVYVNGVTSDNWKSGWTTSPYTIPVDGEVVLAVQRANEQADPYMLEKANSFIYLETATSLAEAYISSFHGFEQKENLIDKSAMVKGYITSDTAGDVSDSNSTAGAYERTTGFFPVEVGDTFSVIGRFTDESKIVADPYITWHFYDEDFVGIGSRYGGKLTLNRDINGKGYVYCPIVALDIEGIKYMRVSFRTFDCILPAMYQGITRQPYIPSNAEMIKLSTIQNMPSPVSIRFPIKSINHRGLTGGGIPENSIPAFKNSKLNGFDMVETDIWQTSDNHFILWHNNTITIDGVTQAPNLFTLEELRSVSIGTGDYAGTQLPTLEEFLALCKAIDLYPYLELKYVDESGAAAIVQMIEDYGIKEKCTFISFNSGMLEFVSKYYPQARLGFMGSIDTAIGLKNGVNEVFFGNNGAPSSTTLTKAKTYDVAIECYTINSESTMLALDPYVTGVTSDNKIFTKVLYDANIALP